MAATKADAPGATSALNFDVINAWADARELSRGDLADRLGIDRTTLWRWQEGLVIPTFEAVRDVARRLGLTVDEITRQPHPAHEAAPQGNPTPPPPSGPTTPPPPSGPPKSS